MGDVGHVGAREIGELSPDGSRRWDGKYWIRVENADPPTDIGRAFAREAATEFFVESRGAGIGGVVIASVVGVILTHLQFNLPAVVPPSQVLQQLAITNLIWLVFSYGTLIAILSVGRYGVDVMLLRAMVVAFVLGAAFVWLSPLSQVLSGPDWIKVLLLSGMTFALLLGPILAVYSTVANVIWYRGTRQLRPQILRTK